MRKTTSSGIKLRDRGCGPMHRVLGWGRSVPASMSAQATMWEHGLGPAGLSLMQLGLQP